MRINKFVALATGLSRRSVDKIIRLNKVRIGSEIAKLGDQVVENVDKVYLNEKLLHAPTSRTLLLLNKPTGYVTSRNGQGSKTIYELIPTQFKNLKPIGRLDKDSSGLILLTDDGDLAYQLSHPKFAKDKSYLVILDRKLSVEALKLVNDFQVQLDGKPSRMHVKNSSDGKSLEINLKEGRNRQIRRTFEKIGYQVQSLQRISFGQYKLADLGEKSWIELDN